MLRGGSQGRDCESYTKGEGVLTYSMGFGVVMHSASYGSRRLILSNALITHKSKSVVMAAVFCGWVQAVQNL
jgi:hypothetical protein